MMMMMMTTRTMMMTAAVTKVFEALVGVGNRDTPSLHCDSPLTGYEDGS
jgi:hypothetical protein